MAAEFIFSDGVSSFRIRSYNSKLCTDMALTPTGFAGTESLDEGVTGDWINIESLPTTE